MRTATEKELREVAQNISEFITIRTYVNGCSYDDKRLATEEEKAIIYNIVYGALLTVDWHCNYKIGVQPILDMAEFTFNNFFKGKGYEPNGYDTIYTPLKKVITNWIENDVL